MPMRLRFIDEATDTFGREEAGLRVLPFFREEYALAARI